MAMFRFLANIFRALEPRLRLAITQGDVDTAHKLIKKGVTSSNFNSIPFLKTAINYNNLEIVCMLLYYCPSIDYFWDCCSPLRYAIMKRRSADIQRILLDYEDFNVEYSKPTLFLAVHFKSPVIIDMLERGLTVEPYYNFCTFNNIVIHAMEMNANIEVVRALWSRFDYLRWKQYSPHSILTSFIRNHRYLSVLMENEQKLHMVIGHHHQTQWKSFVGELYVSKMQRLTLYNESEIEGEVLHLLSYGAIIYTSDLDCMYHHSSDPSREFFKILLHMDLKHADIRKISPLYFKYTPVPNLNKFICCACSGLTNISNLKKTVDIIQEVGTLYSFVTCRRTGRSFPCFVVNSLPHYTYYYRKIFMLSNHFPTLKQLARDASRVAITQRYEIRNSCQLYRIIECLPLPKSIKDIIRLETPLYPVVNFSLIYDSSEIEMEQVQQEL